MKNDFYFILKALSILKVFIFFSGLFSFMWENDLIKKLRLISKFMTSQPWKQTAVIHIFPNNSRSKGSQTIKYREK